jgi:hypothetical protein
MRHLIILLSIAAATSSAMAQDPTADFFPLSIGNSWTYNYSALSDDEYACYGNDKKGTAIYSVLSKTVTCDSIIWGMTEIRNVVRTMGYYFPPSYTTKDTIVDTTRFSIIEYLRDNHRLIKTGLKNWESVFAMTAEYSDSTSYFRYFPMAKTDTFSLTFESPRFSPNSSLFEHFITTYQKNLGIIKVAYGLKIVAGRAWTDHHLKSSIITSVESRRGESVPGEFAVMQNYPNPFNSSTAISFVIPRETKLTVRVYDLLGRLNETLFDNRVDQGSHSIVWNAADKTSGVYVCVFQTENSRKSIKLVLLR